MNLVRNTAAIAIPLILASTAWIEPGTSTTSPGVADAVLALLAFALMLTDQVSMGFLFIILSLGRLNWIESLLIADSAILLVTIAKSGRTSPRSLLRNLGSTS